MNADIIPACPLALTADDLSRFRDSDTPAGRGRVIEDHLTSCAACRARLAEFDHIGTGLRAIPEPALDDDRFWREVEARASGRRLASAASRAHLRHTFTGLGAVAAALLVAIAFNQLLASHSGPKVTASSTATNPPSPTIAPVRAVTWKQLAFPITWDHPNGSATPGAATPTIGSGVTYSNATLGFTAADSNIVYACVSHFDTGSAIYTIWISRDRGATWSRAGALPSNQQAGCEFIVDSADAQKAVVRLSWYQHGASPLQPSGLDFATTDGGHSWTALPGNFGYAQMTSYRGKVYVLRLDQPGDPNQGYRLMMSSDALHTWIPLDQPLADASTTISAFWLNPADGSILAYAFSGSSRSFWSSPDTGRSWQKLSHPGSDLLQTIAVQWPLGSESWHICVAGQDASVAPVDQLNHVACTLDGGRTWNDRPALDFTLTCNCDKGRSFTSISGLTLVGIAPDGALLATVTDRYDDSGNAHIGLYRLSPNATKWEPVGDASPDGRIFLLPSGVLWMSSWQPTSIASFWTEASYVSTATYP